MSASIAKAPSFSVRRKTLQGGGEIKSRGYRELLHGVYESLSLSTEHLKKK